MMNIQLKSEETKINLSSDMKREFKFLYSTCKWKGVPIIAFNSNITGTFEIYDVLSPNKIITRLHESYTMNDFKEKMKKTILDPNYFMISTSIQESSFSNLHEIISIAKAKWIYVDIGKYSEKRVIAYCNKLRLSFPDCTIFAGNVETSEMAEKLILHGKVDGIKLLTNADSKCFTSETTFMNCVNTIHNIGGIAIEDCAITCPYDIRKAFDNGVDFVMVRGTMENIQ
jgi:GMP reductase